VAEALEDFKDLAPRGKLPAGLALVVIHGAHEFDFLIGIIALACRRVDLSAAFDLAARAHAALRFGERHGAGSCATVGDGPARCSAPIGDNDLCGLFKLTHGRFPAALVRNWTSQLPVARLIDGRAGKSLSDSSAEHLSKL